MEIERAPHDKNRSTKDKRGSDILQPVGETFTFQILIRTPCKHTHTHTHTQNLSKQNSCIMKERLNVQKSRLVKFVSVLARAWHNRTLKELPIGEDRRNAIAVVILFPSVE